MHSFKMVLKKAEDQTVDLCDLLGVSPVRGTANVRYASQSLCGQCP